MTIDVGQLDAHRAALVGHCYRMLGSAADAEDAVQETMLRAWRSLDRFEARASVRTWLYRIATNVCLDVLSTAERRARPMQLGDAGTIDHPLETRDRTHWLEPIADVRAIPADADPHEIAVLRQSIRLAFVAVLQQLPPRQRAVLLLTEVLGWSAAEVAEGLEMTVAAVNSALQRARATIGHDGAPRAQEQLTEHQQTLLDRYVDAFLRYDVDALVSLLRDDVTFSMPPYTLWLRGPENVRGWLTGRGAACRGSRLVPVQACASPSFAQYRAAEAPGTYRAWGLIVLETDGEQITGWNTFLDTERIFPMFGLPLDLAD